MIPVTLEIQSRYMVTSVKPAGAPLSQPRVDPKETTPICSYWAPGMDNGPPESPCKIVFFELNFSLQ